MAKQSLLTRIKANARNRDANANATLVLMGEAIDNYRGAGEYEGKGGDWTNLAWIVSLAIGADKTRLKDIIEAASGVTFRADPKQPSGLRIASKGEENNRVALLAEYTARGFSFRSKVLEEGVDGLEALLVAKDAKVRTVEEIMLAAVRKAKRDCGDAATKARIMAAVGAALAAEF